MSKGKKYLDNNNDPKEMKHIFIVFIFLASTISCVYSQNNLEILTGSLWTLQGAENQNFTFNFEGGEVTWNVNNEFTLTGLYYLSDEQDLVFDHSKVGSEESGGFIILLTGESKDVYTVLEIIRIEPDTMELNTSGQSYNLDFIGTRK